MRDSLAFFLTFVALVQLAFGIGGVLLPPDPFLQAYVWTGGTIAAAVVAVWFVWTGAERLDATVADVWLFFVSALGLMSLSQLFVPTYPTRPLAVGALVATVAMLVAGWFALAVGVDGLREAVGRAS
ncbi:hypothetical protein [Halomicrobium salinisoli]|uniref:hypothetical protein n=1 Tax=Halomicrobium salinisoli TaxID=2878391 RepID=UPI001CF065BB|nr:hypothetical protein [Halomicrobium salinisoli]